MPASLGMDRDAVDLMLQRASHLEDQRDEWDRLHEDIRDFILPYGGVFPGRGEQPDRGLDKTGKIINSAATQGLNILAAGMQGGLTSPARQWFKLMSPDPDLNEFRLVKSWLADVERRMDYVLARSNFYDIIHNGYRFQGGFGNCCLAEEEDQESVVRFVLFPVGQYSVAEGASGRVDTVYRRFYMTVHAAAQRFGLKTLSRKAQDLYERQPFEYIEILHVFEPRRPVPLGRIDRRAWPWRSVYLEYGAEWPNVLEVGGYQEQAVFCARWDATGDDAYGRGPCHDILPDVKMLQSMEVSALKAQHLQTQPPMLAPTQLRGRIKRSPGSWSFVDDTMASNVKPLYPQMVAGDVRGAEARIQRVVDQIMRALHVDVFLMLEQGHSNMTATEVLEKKAEKLLILGPVIERQFHELLDPIIDRTFAIMVRRGMIPPAPQELQGMPLRVDYVSLLAQAQKQVATKGLDAVVDHATRVAQVDPSVIDGFDAMRSLQDYAEALGVDPKVIRSAEDVARIRQQREAEAAERQKAEQLAAMVEGAHKLGNAKATPDTALGQVAEAMEQ